MNRSLALLVFASAFGCGSETGSSNGTKNFPNFQGAPAWSGSVTTTRNCPGAAPASSSAPFTLILSSGAAADLQYANLLGCVYQFNISGNTASLSNAPVACSLNGITDTWTSYTLTTANGHSLDIAAAGTELTSTGQTCPFTQAGTATR